MIFVILQIHLSTTYQQIVILSLNQLRQLITFIKEIQFEYVVESAKSKELSTSLLYSIENLRGLIEPLSDLSEVHKTQIKKLFEYEVSHSRGNSNDSKKLAEALATICIPYSKSEEHKTDWFNPDAAVVANFIAKADGKTSDEVNEYEEGNE